MDSDAPPMQNSADKDADRNVDVSDEPGNTATGPVISMPLTQSADAGTPLITTASPAMIMGIMDEKDADVAESAVEIADTDGEESTESTAGY